MIQTGFWDSEAYCPVLEFANGNIRYLPRTKIELLAAADELYLAGKYQDALNYTQDCFELNLSENMIPLYFNFENVSKDSILL